jgi:predicted TIM-barrel fold metal-dependent hydrolase
MHLTLAARTVVEQRLVHLQRVRRHVTIDGDTHPSGTDLFDQEILRRTASDLNYYHGRPVTGDELLREMDQAGVDMALSWQNPAVTRYGSDIKENFRSLEAANRYISRFSGEHPTRIIPAGWTDPKALGVAGAIDLVRLCVEEFGFPVVKMNPAQNRYRIDSREVTEVLDAIVALGAVPAFHFGSDSEFTPADGLEAIAARHPEHPVIAVHMGGGGGHYVEADPLYIAARELGLKRPNIFYILSAKRDTHIESALITYLLAGEPFSRNIAVGSDIPYGRITWNFGGYRGLFAALKDSERHNDARVRNHPGLFTDAAVQNFMGGNLADLIIRSDQRLLNLSSGGIAQ